MTTGVAGGMIVESATAQPWSSLTFAGERHAVVVRLPPGTAPAPVDGADLVLTNAIVAVERADWAADADGARLSLDLLLIAYPR